MYCSFNTNSLLTHNYPVMNININLYHCIISTMDYKY